MIVIPSLHTASEYSLLESTIKLDDLIAFALKKNLKQLVITDHNHMFGVSEFVYKCQQHQIKPIIGLDLDVEDFRLILLAKNYQGYQELIRLSSLKNHNQMLKLSQLNVEHLFVIDHPQKGYYAQKQKLLQIANYFVANGPSSLTNVVQVFETKILKQADNAVLEILNFIKTGQRSQPKSFNYQPYVYTGDPTLKRVQQIVKIVQACNVDFPSNQDFIPRFASPHNLSSQAYFRQLLTSGFQKKITNVNQHQAYQKRLDYEMETIEQLGFIDYFLIIHDLVHWAKSQKIGVGPGRGSAAGSLVAYLLNITEVDPLKYDLLFERFLNPERVSWPDIDLDFQDDRRDEVLQYIFAKYGSKNVGLISTFQRLGARMALRDVARYLKVPLRDVDQITKTIPVNFSLAKAYKRLPAFRAFINQNQTFTKLFTNAQMLEGLPRQTGTHAAGIVISARPLCEIVPTMIGLDQYNQIQFPMDHLEAYGLLKIDLLGLRNITILHQIQAEIYQNHHKQIALAKISTQDLKTNELLSSGDTNGIFQLESYGMKKALAKVGVNSLDDVVAILALYRPGPMEYINTYAAIKNGHQQVKSIAPLYDQVLKPTYGIIVYQEQIMQIAQKFAHMSFAQADILRRAISKKESTTIHALKSTFMSGAFQAGHDQATSEQVYAMIEKFANYGFNKSHAVAYGILSYRLAFLKAHFPFEFYTALIRNSMGSQTAIARYVNEAKTKSILIISPNVNLSHQQTYNDQQKIVLPLQMIKGFGISASTKVLTERKRALFTDFFDFVARMRLKGLGESTIQLLIEANALRDFGNMQTLITALPLALRYTKLISIKQNNELKLDFSLASKPQLIVKKRELKREIEHELKLFGFRLNVFETTTWETETKLLNLAVRQAKWVIVYVEKIFITQDRNGQKMARALVFDSSKKMELNIFAHVLEQLKSPLHHQVVRAKIESRIYQNLVSYVLLEPWERINDG